jgi:hypothetical protein
MRRSPTSVPLHYSPQFTTRQDNGCISDWSSREFFQTLLKVLKACLTALHQNLMSGESKQAPTCAPLTQGRSAVLGLWDEHPAAAARARGRRR